VAQEAPTLPPDAPLKPPVLLHRPFAALAQVRLLVPATSRPVDSSQGRPGAARLGLTRRGEGSSSRDIQAVRAEEIRRGARRPVL